MKMRKLFALLVASALLAAMAIVPANAAITGTYTVEYNAENVPGFDGGTSATTGGEVLATIAGTQYLAKLLPTANSAATEVVLSVTAGDATISFTTSAQTSSCLQVKVNADGTYAVRVPAGNVASGEYTGDEVTVSYFIDAVNSRAIFVVNGNEHIVTADSAAGSGTVGSTNYANSTGDYALLKISGTAGTAATVKSIKFGPSFENTVIQSGDKDVTVTVDPTNQDATPATKDVTIAFGDFAFTYTVTNKVNPSNGEILESEGSWSATTDTVEITNNTTPNYEGENVTVWATASYAPVANAVPGVSFTLDNTDANELGAGEDVTITGTISGTPTNVKNGVSAVVLGTITVVVESVNPAA